MAQKSSRREGSVALVRFESAVLKNNPLGDPHVRTVPIYLPPSYFEDTGRRFPAIYLLAGYTGRGVMALNAQAWGENIKERCDRLIRQGKLVETIVVMPDCFTRFGGSQYLNSIANGNYEDHVVKELIGYVDEQYRTIDDPSGRAVMGKSSGGYGALVLGMRHPDVFGSVACHSGDMYFELCYKPDFPKYAGKIRQYGGTRGFLKKFFQLDQKWSWEVLSLMNVVAMACAYSPRKRRDVPFELPFDEHTCELNPKVWREWLAWDPVTLVDRYARNLRKLKLLYLDCGTKDEFNLQFGARILAAKLKALNIKHTYEEFADGHRNIQYRYDRSLTLISKVFKRFA